jgi:hypothetical protein
MSNYFLVIGKEDIPLFDVHFTIKKQTVNKK